MTIPHTPQTERRRRDGDRRDGGFILATLGLLIIPIIAFTALAVDVSSWYSRATELQRSADAGALGGVVWMPALGDATTAATAVLAKNNVVNGSNDLTVTIQQGSAANSLQVCITDHSAPQYFSKLFSAPEQLTRCGTAQFNLPLELGSPLNYYGGNSSANLGTYPETTTSSTNQTSPPGGNWNLTPDNVGEKVLPSQGGGSHGCSVWTSGSSSKQQGYIYYPNNTRWTADGGGTPKRYLNTKFVWNYNGTNYYGSDLPNCYWTVTTTNTVNKPINPIPSSKSPNFWAAIAGPGMFIPNGDARAPRCLSSGNCGTADNPFYTPSGYDYALDVPAGTTSGPISMQIFDATQSQTSGTAATGDVLYGGTTIQHTAFTLYDSGSTPYDRGDDTVVPGCTLTTHGSNPAFDKKWVQMCSFTPIVGRRYYLNVRSSATGSETWGTQGNTYNGYALRAVAGSFPASCLNLDASGVPQFPQSSSTACYGADPQPRLSGYQYMEMYNGIPASTPTQFFFANVKQEYAGKTLVLELWDPGDGNGNSFITVMKPGVSTAGTPLMGCSYTSTRPSGSVDQSATLSSSQQCRLQTTSSGSNAFQNEWVHIKVNLPSTYTCDSTVNPVTTGGSCWWQIKYETSSSLNDYTTWTARIEGDPVRLIQ